MAACDKGKGSDGPRDVEEVIVMKKVLKLNATPSDEVDAAPSPQPRPSFERQSSLEKLQFNAKRAIVAGMLDITLVTDVHLVLSLSNPY